MSSLIFYTTKPRGLLKAIREGIDDESIVTWAYDKDGDFRHTPDQWEYRAWLSPTSAQEGKLEFKILWPEGEERNDTVYAVYHGRFIEMVLSHFPERITRCVAMP